MAWMWHSDKKTKDFWQFEANSTSNLPNSKTKMTSPMNTKIWIRRSKVSLWDVRSQKNNFEIGVNSSFRNFTWGSFCFLLLKPAVFLPTISFHVYYIYEVFGEEQYKLVFSKFFSISSCFSSWEMKLIRCGLADMHI